jgi:hypothetical protein
MFIRTSITIALCAALLACGGKDKKTEDGDADAGPDAEDVTEVTDPPTDPIEETPEDPVPDLVEDVVEDTVEDSVEDTVEDTAEDTVEDAEEDAEDDVTTDAEEDAEDDAEMDAVDDATDVSVDGGSDVSVDGGSTVMLFFSEYVEGSSYNKAVEIYNAGSAAYDIAGCTVNIYYNGNTTVGDSITLSSVSLAADDVHVLCHSSFTSTGTSTCDQMDGNLAFNGDDAVELVCGGTTYDVIGQIGTDPGSRWGTGSVSTENHTLQRKCTITAGDADGSDAFDPSTEWDGFSIDTFTGLGDHCP